MEGLMRKIIISIIIFAGLYTVCFAQTKELQFRLVLTYQESKSTPFDKYIDNSGNEILVSKNVLLSNKDIDKIGIVKGKFNEYFLIVEFNSEGKSKFFEVTRNYINRQLAQIVNDKVLSVPLVREAIDTGKCRIYFFPSFSEAETLIKKIGFAPYLQDG